MDCGLSPDHHLQERGQGPPGASTVRGRPPALRPTGHDARRATSVFPAPPSAHDKETAINPAISYYLVTDRATELRSQAQRAALARAARHARTHKLEHAAPGLAAAGRRLLTYLRPRGT
jgi:hypothetical protein